MRPCSDLIASSIADKPCMLAIIKVIGAKAFCIFSLSPPRSAIEAEMAFRPPTKPRLTLVSEDITAPKSRLLYLAVSVISICFCCKSASCFAARLYSILPSSSCASSSFNCLICCLNGTNDLVKFSTFFWACPVDISITFVLVVLIYSFSLRIVSYLFCYCSVYFRKSIFSK